MSARIARAPDDQQLLDAARKALADPFADPVWFVDGFISRATARAIERAASRARMA